MLDFFAARVYLPLQQIQWDALTGGPEDPVPIRTLTPQQEIESLKTLPYPKEVPIIFISPIFMFARFSRIYFQPLSFLLVPSEKL
jgi:hypothetical protein